MSSSKSDDSNQFAEWTKARDVINFFDDKKHDLRKYGFSFVAGLLTAQALISAPLTGVGAVTDYVKLAIILVSLILISMMRVTEKTYELVQKGVNFRLTVLENKLNLGLSKSISAVYNHYRMSWFVTGLYIFFFGATGLLGFAVLYTSTLRYVAIAITIIGAIILWTLDSFFRSGAVDLDMDKLSYVQGDVITVTLTNISEKPLSIEGNMETAIKIKGAASTLTQTNMCSIGKFLSPRSAYLAQFDTKTAIPGIYCLVFNDPFAKTKLTKLIGRMRELESRMKKKSSIKEKTEPTMETAVKTFCLKGSNPSLPNYENL